MNKSSLILRFFQKKDQLTVENKEYRETVSSLFLWFISNDKVTDDKTTKYFPNNNTHATIIAKEAGVISGLEEIGFLLNKYTKLVFNPKIKDGSGIKNKDTIAEIKGKSHDILAFERTILNVLQRMSGIATETNRLIKIINQQSTINNQQSFLAATRKTPWMGLDKKAVAVGGGLTHRLNLSDGILVKDNHLVNITVEEALEIFLKRSDLRGGPTSMELIEIEIEREKYAHSAIKTFQRLNTNNYLAILLDNFSPSAAKALVSSLNHSQIIIEASGGINKDNLKAWSQTGVDILSLGALTHSVSAMNLSLEF